MSAEGPKEPAALYMNSFFLTQFLAAIASDTFIQVCNRLSIYHGNSPGRTVFLTVPAADASIIIKHRPGSEFGVYESGNRTVPAEVLFYESHMFVGWNFKIVNLKILQGVP